MNGGIELKLVLRRKEDRSLRRAKKKLKKCEYVEARWWLIRAAIEDVDGDALCMLGMCYLETHMLLLIYDSSMAQWCFWKAANLGHGLGMFHYAKYSPDPSVYYKMAYESGHPYAQAHCYLNDLCVDCSVDKYVNSLKKAAEHCMFALNDLRTWYMFRDAGLEYNYALEAARKGHPRSQHAMAQLYLDCGITDGRAMINVWRWMKKAADQGNTSSIRMLIEDSRFVAFQKRHNARMAIVCLIITHTYDTPLKYIHKDIIDIIAHCIWDTCNADEWLFVYDQRTHQKIYPKQYYINWARHTIFTELLCYSSPLDELRAALKPGGALSLPYPPQNFY